MRKQLIVSNSIMNRLFPDGEEKDICPYRFLKCNIQKEFREKSTEAMDKGKFFEYLCIGASADKDDMVTDLTRLKSGNKSVDQERIESQVIMFQRLLEEFNIKIEEIQQKYHKEWDHEFNIWMATHEVIIQGTIDFRADLYANATDQNGEEKVLNLPRCIHDLKLTADIWEIYGRGSWAYPWSMSHSQVAMYQYLTGSPFCYWVFDYKPRPEFRLWNHEATDIEKMELHETIRKTVEKFVEYEDNNWPKKPAYYRCATCPVGDHCDKKTTKPAFMIF